jgi:4a-hydroxytetrahydrobiopterin dehydratase
MDKQLWTAINNTLVKEFEFADFKSAVDFINRVAIVAEKQNHHPDIFLHSYKCVKITLITHSENKITEKDYKLEDFIDKLFTK